MIETLETIQNRVLWLATNMIHHANYNRPNPDGSKVGGHQASSASMVTILTALYFHYLNAGDLVSVKPHASPAYHAIQYLLGQISRDYLPRLREFGGLQAYPSRTKDPDKVDFSTGSVGLGAVAPLFAALADRYTRVHFGAGAPRRFVAIVGDAELDEGNVWEALLDDSLNTLNNMLLIIDLNRQSLDRVVPGIKANRLKALFAGCNWRVIEAKYGRHLQEYFDRPDGDRLRICIDEMNNAAYQSLIRLPGPAMRAQLLAIDPKLEALLADVPDDRLGALISNLGGHDFQELFDRFAEADADANRPTVLFAYTIKGWGLPIAGHPLNHSMLLEPEQIEALRAELGVGEDEWAGFPAGSTTADLIEKRRQHLFPADAAAPPAPTLTVPDTIPLPAGGLVSTQQQFGRALLAISREEALAKHMVTVSPDVSVSTNLSGWINKMGVFTASSHEESSQEHWTVTESGQHIELGISEMNLFMALGMLGLANELLQKPLLPIGTVYDPFICRGLDAFIYSLYSESKFIIAGTPSGVTLSPEGGAHQSTVTSSLGMELPNLHFYEPCYSDELLWILLASLRDLLDRENGRATYLRLSTKPIDQAPLEAARARLGEERLRRQVLAGGYRLHDWRGAEDVYKEYLVHIAAAGAMIPEALAAAAMLEQEGIPANVLNITSPRRLYETWQASYKGLPEKSQAGSANPFNWLIPHNERHAPLITVNDGASHAFAWLGSIFGMYTVPLGVDKFGQSGDRASLYRAMEIDSTAIVDAALKALERIGL
ncbi:MAG: hypothetical protein KDE04_17165 [Anaerolineales bacterium]|nr:hypothetical protein [Anaerolineales bacterium]